MPDPDSPTPEPPDPIAAALNPDGDPIPELDDSRFDREEERAWRR